MLPGHHVQLQRPKPTLHLTLLSPLSSFMWTMNFRAWQWKWLSWVCFTNSEMRCL